MGRNAIADARRRDSRRREILDTAQAMFAKGRICPVEDVATRLGLAKGTVYLYFPSKGDLLAAVVQRSMDELMAALREAAAGKGSPEERIAGMVRCAVRSYREQRLVLKVWMDAPADARRPVRVRWQKESRALFHKVLQAGMKSGAFRSHDPELVATCAMAMTRGVIFYEGRLSSDALADGITDLILESLRSR